VKGFLIDPDRREVVDAGKAGLEAPDLFALLSRPGGQPVHTVDCISLGPKLPIWPAHRIWVDGLAHRTDGTPVWWWDDFPDPIAGRGLLLGITALGEAGPPSLTIDQVRAAVRWDDRVSSGEFHEVRTAQHISLKPTLRTKE
jgi:hypothetical protein